MEDQTKKSFEDQGESQKLETCFRSTAPLAEAEKESIKDLAIKGLRVAEIARKVKRSKASVSRVLKPLRMGKALTIAKAERIVDEKLHAARDLRKIHDRAFEILEKLKTQNRQDVEKYGFLVLKACDSVRKNLELHLRLCEALYNAEAVARWQDVVLEILGEIDPDARERFYRRYQESRPA
jgi:IS30 family transposase